NYQIKMTLLVSVSCYDTSSHTQTKHFYMSSAAATEVILVIDDDAVTLHVDGNQVMLDQTTTPYGSSSSEESEKTEEEVEKTETSSEREDTEHPPVNLKVHGTWCKIKSWFSSLEIPRPRRV
ncbi:unnamed protein product, partial [Meganyctiphanes norvegica]